MNKDVRVNNDFGDKNGQNVNMVTLSSTHFVSNINVTVEFSVRIRHHENKIKYYWYYQQIFIEY